MKEKRIHRYNHIWVPGVVTFVVFAAVYLTDGFYPFGTGSVAALDLNTQYLPLLYKFYDVLKGTGGVIIDYHIAGGMNLYQEMITELLNPFNYLLLLFRRDQLYMAVNILLMLYGVAASVTAAYALDRICRKRSFFQIVFSVCYGLSFYNAYQFEIIRWMYLAVLFPLFAVSLKRLLEEEKVTGFTLLLAYQIILSLQLGFQTCLFTLCAAICYMLYLRSEAGLRREIGRKCLILGCAVAAGLMISSVNMLPAVYNIIRSARSAENQALILVLSRHGLDDLPERLLEIGHPVVFGVLAGLLGLRWRKVRRPAEQSFVQRNYTVLFLVWLLATVILQPSNLLWHLGYYQCFPVRYGYMILFVMTAFAAKVCDEERQNGAADAAAGEDTASRRDPAAWILSAAAAVTIAVCLLFAAGKRLMFSYAFATLAISRICVKETLLFYGLMLFLAVSAAVAYVLSVRAQNKSIRICGSGILLAAAAAAGAVFYLCILFPQDFGARTESEASYRTMSERGNAAISYSETGHINDEESLLLNAPLVSGEYSMTAYMPAGADLRFSAAMDDLGYSSPWISVRSKGGTVISDVLLGIRNPYVQGNGLHNGILVSKEAYGRMKGSFKTRASLLAQQAVLKMMCSETSFEADDIIQLHSGDSLQVDVTEPVLIYACTGGSDRTLFVNGEMIEKEEAQQSQNPAEICFLGEYDHERITVSAADGDLHSMPAGETEFAVIRLQEFRLMCEELAAKNRRRIEPDDRQCRLHVRAEEPMEGVLLLPFAYLDGYRADVQETYGGQTRSAVPAASFLNGLLRVDLDEPVTELTLTYHYGVLKPAFAISLAGMLLLAVVLLMQRKLPLTVPSRAAGAVFVLIAALFVSGVYLAPNLGLAGYMTGRLFGKDLLASYREESGGSESGPVLLQAAAEGDGIRVVIAGKNLVTSLGARLSADTAESKAFKAQKAGDGIVNDASSRWSSENNWVSAEHYLQVDLRSKQTIRALRIFWFQNNAKTYDILVSDDKAFAEHTVAASFSMAPAAKEQVVYFDAPYEARYLRVAVKDVKKEEADLSLYYQNVSIEELEIYGEDSESFLIDCPVLAGGRDREIPIPAVPDGYALSVGGINYQNLLADEKHFADTCAPVKIRLGYVLKCGSSSFELPGFDVVLPASDGGAEAADGQETDVGNGTVVCGVTVREWKAAAGTCQTSDERIFEQADPALYKALGEEGYRIDITGDSITLSAASEKGLCWAHVTLEQMMRETDSLPCGIIRDYPAYPVRGFCIDVARRPIRMEMLYEIVDALSAEKMNTLQIHLNDNAIIAESGYDGTQEGARNLYSAFRLESELAGETGETPTAKDLYYTKEEFKALVEYARLKGVEIVPEIDTPAHSMAFTKVMPSLGYKDEPELADTLDVNNPETLDFAKRLWAEYLSADGGGEAVFEKCGAVHLGMDEYYGKSVPYENYLIGLSDHVKALAPDKKIRIWGSLSAIGADLNRIPKDLELMLWNSYWADPEAMYRAGFGIINCQNSDLYIIVGGGTDRLDVERLSQSWQPERFADGNRTVTIPAWSERMLGACYSLWSDHYTKGIDDTTEADLMERIMEPLPIIAGKLW